MEEIKQSAEASDQNAAAGNESVAESSDESAAPAEFSDSGTEAEGEGAKQTKEQSKKQNSENARRRREAAERERQRHEADLARERNSARQEAILEVLRRRNPYTGEEMKDSRDVEEYLAMKEIEEKGGDPVGDFAKHYKERERLREAKAAEREEKKRWYADDRKSFETKYPDVDLGRLVEDPDFADYADGKVGTRSLVSIYEGYMELMGKNDSRAREMAARMLANKKASPGSLGGSESGGNYFSRDQVRKMSSTEVKKHYEAIRESMSRWK